MNKAPDTRDPRTRDNQKQPLINENIRFRRMMVIDENGNNLGEMDRDQALRLANQANLDLVLIARRENKPVVKILDYGKFRYEQKRKQRENRKNQTITKVKEIKIKPTIGDHDLNVRIENAKKWLADKDHVKFVIVARGRMASKIDIINEAYQKFASALEGVGNFVQANKKINDMRYETLIEPLKK
ncbi:translation initiation factor IF-3 [Ureaplasma miroungigenitalium]|uniref:Translation initiation factor IF-3 n=1 Tax=Ureaplasma miroungigenitalium TaxID=1042321 RepID=A0ABT3BMF4_9BACT|nr:translation initiation factor IF-3 [Ureaplasma miroungigenitalium]MCV3728416.1 translation initiation factor IF-3 [Ureaplasma miroungigenitalium]MCV3734203.1 translation initiation factor IF-3 [Ureaplasma miroungigenitalium]